MADRKRTPDILSEVLGNTPTPAPAATVADLPMQTPPAAPKPAPRAAARPAAPPHAARQRAVAPCWTYLIVSFQNHGGWRPRYANGAELDDWTAQPEMHEYANQLGQEGWELAGASGGQKFYGVADNYQLYFKRPA